MNPLIFKCKNEPTIDIFLKYWAKKKAKKEVNEDYEQLIEGMHKYTFVESAMNMLSVIHRDDLNKIYYGIWFDVDRRRVRIIRDKNM